MSQSVCIFVPKSGFMIGAEDGPSAVVSFLEWFWYGDDCRHSLGYHAGLAVSIAAMLFATAVVLRLLRHASKALARVIVYDSETLAQHRQRLDRHAMGFSGKASDPVMIWTKRPIVLAAERVVADMLAFLRRRRRRIA